MNNSTVFLELTFDGTNFFGWDSQPEKRTVFAVLQDSLQKVTRCETSLTPCISLINGCHALQFFVRWNDAKPLPDNFLHRINRCLPEDISVRNIYVSEYYDAKPKRFFYEYHIHHIRQPFLENRSYFTDKLLKTNEFKFENIIIQTISSSTRCVIKMNGEHLTSEKALEIASQIIQSKTLLPAYALYLTAVEYSEFEVKKISPESLFIPEPEWFFMDSPPIVKNEDKNVTFKR